MKLKIGHCIPSIYNPVDESGKDYLRYYSDLWYEWDESILGYTPVVDSMEETLELAFQEAKTNEE